MSSAESILLQIAEKMFCILYVQFTTWFFSFSHRSVTTKTIARLSLHSKPMSNNMFCIGCTLNCFWFSSFCFKREWRAVVYALLFWCLGILCCYIMFMCLTTIKLCKRAWVERSSMHHKFCLLMISVKTLTSSLRSIASMLFVSSLRLVVALNEEGFSLNLLPPLHALKVFFFKKQKSACLNLVCEINPVFSKDEMPMIASRRGTLLF